MSGRGGRGLALLLTRERGMFKGEVPLVLVPWKNVAAGILMQYALSSEQRRRKSGRSLVGIAAVS